EGGARVMDQLREYSFGQRRCAYVASIGVVGPNILRTRQRATTPNIAIREARLGCQLAKVKLRAQWHQQHFSYVIGILLLKWSFTHDASNQDPARGKRSGSS